MAKAAEGVKAASLPVIAKALADEVKYGYRDASEARQLAGSLVLFAGGVDAEIPRRTRYRWRADLRRAGYVVAESFMDECEVELAPHLSSAIESFGRGA